MEPDARDELTTIAAGNLRSMHRVVLAALASFAFIESVINVSTMLPSKAGGASRVPFGWAWPQTGIDLTTFWG